MRNTSIYKLSIISNPQNSSVKKHVEYSEDNCLKNKVGTIEKKLFMVPIV